MLNTFARVYVKKKSIMFYVFASARENSWLEKYKFMKRLLYLIVPGAY